MKPHRRNRTDRRREIFRSKTNGDGGQDVDSETLRCFTEYAHQLDLKHDKYERIVNLSRDITIESKRIIFFLHSLDSNKKRNEVLSEAESRLNKLVSTLFRCISVELEGEDPYQFLRAYSSGLQEFVEALTFYHYLMNNNLQGWNVVEKMLVFNVKSSDDSIELKNTGENFDTESIPDKKEPCDKTLSVLIPPSEYVLGVADLTGELMRNCINNLGSGNMEVCKQTCTFVKEIFKGFLGVGNSGPKEFSRKLFTLRQSLSKMENACYAIHVRGSEIPRNMLADVLQDSGGYDMYEEDEGFY